MAVPVRMIRWYSMKKEDARTPLDQNEKAGEKLHNQVFLKT